LISSQTIAVCSYKHGAEKILAEKLVEHFANVNHTAMRAVDPNVHTPTESVLTTRCATEMSTDQD